LEESKVDLVRDGFMGAGSLSWQFLFIHIRRNTLSCIHDKFFFPRTKKRNTTNKQNKSIMHVMRNYAKCIPLKEKKKKTYKKIKIRHTRCT
jgi:hypothetical protein